MVGWRGERSSVVFGFSSKPMTSPAGLTPTTPKRETSAGSHQKRRQSHVRPGIDVVLEHPAVVHLVDVIAGKDQHVLWLLGADRVNVLIHGIRRAHVPVRAYPLHGRQDLDEFTQLLGHHAAPALADMPIERERLILREDINAS